MGAHLRQIKKLHTLMKGFLKSHFNCGSLIWMCYNRLLSNEIDDGIDDVFKQYVTIKHQVSMNYTKKHPQIKLQCLRKV